MHLNIETLIIGAGYAGLLCQKRLDDIGRQRNFIIDKGDSVKFASRDYVIVMREPTEFTDQNPTKMYLNRINSGEAPFEVEYPRKLYNKETKLILGEEDMEEEEIYLIDNAKLMEGSRVYGNIDVTEIDRCNKIVTGKVNHFNKIATFRYEKLICTIPIYEFAKLCGFDLMQTYNIFVSFFPIGIIRKTAEEYSSEIIMTYFSDPQIPFYRRHHFGKSIFYEYCINKPYSINFHTVIAPGKFMTPDEEKLRYFYQIMAEDCNIFFAGRFATWHTDFRLDDIFHPRENHVASNILREAFIQ